MTEQLALPLKLPSPSPEPTPEEIRQLLVASAEAALGRPLKADERHYLLGPVVYHKGSGWAETVPAWIEENIPRARIEALGTDIASDLEVVAYLYTASLAAPMDHDFAHMYIVVACKMLMKYGVYEELPGQLAEEYKRGLTDWQAEQLRDLKYKIRRKVVNAHKRR